MNAGDNLVARRTQHRDAVMQARQRLQRVEFVVDKLGSFARVARQQPQNEQIHPHGDQGPECIAGIGIGRNEHPAFRVARPFANAEFAAALRNSRHHPQRIARESKSS